MICPFPDLSALFELFPGLPASSTSNSSQTKQRRQIDTNCNVINPDNVTFYLGFQLDGVSSDKFTEIYVHKDPILYKFQEENHMKNFYPERNRTLTINVGLGKFIIIIINFCIQF